jgi:hypothetical protein
MDHEPEPWETNAAAPFLSVGNVGVQSLGQDRFLVVTPDDEQTVTGFDPALTAPCGLSMTGNGAARAGVCQGSVSRDIRP